MEQIAELLHVSPNSLQLVDRFHNGMAPASLLVSPIRHDRASSHRPGDYPSTDCQIIHRYRQFGYYATDGQSLSYIIISAGPWDRGLHEEH